MDYPFYLCQKINHKQMQIITIAKGDGIGPEIMDATLKIIKATGANRIVLKSLFKKTNF
jgi:isocitrate/isopropylmalate dehydrogenase